MNFIHKSPKWDNVGAEPTEELKKKGFTAGYKPPASYFNWFWNRVSNCIKEIQEKLGTVEEHANNYTHPTTHDAEMITQDEVHRFVSDSKIEEWENKLSSNDVINNLDSTDTTKPLSAAMGTELKKSVSDGKKIVASAITAKGQATNTDDTFSKMAENISRIQTGVDIDISQINANENYIAYGATAYGEAYYGGEYKIINGRAFPPYKFSGYLRTDFKYGVTSIYTYTGLRNGNNTLPFDGLTNVTGRFFGLVVMGNVYYQKNNGDSLIEILNIPTPVFLTQTNNTITKTISYGGGTITSTCILKPDNCLYVIINYSGVDSSTSDIEITTDLIVYPIYGSYGNRYYNYVTYRTENVWM